MTELHFSQFGVMFLTEWPLVWSLLHFPRGVYHSVRRQTPSAEVNALTFRQGKQCFGTFPGGAKFCLVSTFSSRKYGPSPFIEAPGGGTRPLQDLIIPLSSSTSAWLQQLGGILDPLQAMVIYVRYAVSMNEVFKTLWVAVCVSCQPKFKHVKRVSGVVSHFQKCCEETAAWSCSQMS